MSDVALRISPHFDLSWVSRNSKLHKLWGREENLATTKFPFARKNFFTIEIFTTDAAFLVAVNCRHFCEYKHRVHRVLTNTLHIKGDLSLDSVEFRNVGNYPWTANKAIESLHQFNINKLTVPITLALNGTLNMGAAVQLRGRVKLAPSRFHMNLQEGCQTYPHPTVALHFNPRFDGEQCEIVLNSWLDHWGHEEKISAASNLLRPNQLFLVTIRCQPSGFQIEIDGVLVTIFAHRMSADLVNALAIDGDVIVDQVLTL